MLKTLLIIPLMIMAACGGGQSRATETAAADIETAPADNDAAALCFDADSAFAYVAAQTAFGPRVPNTAAHRQCAAWMADKLGELGATNVVTDTCSLRAYDGTMLTAYNITAQLNPDANKRILLLSHWDSRPWADHDDNPANRRKPIDGANDGASGVGVIFELVRALSAANTRVGVDILLADAEDYGRHADDQDTTDDEDTWALGTQHWVESPTIDLQKVRYAILLDMVGGKDAKFPREYFSNRYAKDINDKVWQAAGKAGYGDRFVHRIGSPVIDDHIYLLRAGIPAIDIIETDHPETGSFNPTWHTVNDNIDNIDPQTLKAVGQTLLTLLATE